MESPSTKQLELKKSARRRKEPLTQIINRVKDTTYEPSSLFEMIIVSLLQVEKATAGEIAQFLDNKFQYSKKW